jgi:hypothetical protein
MNWERDERMSSPSPEFTKQKAPVARRMKRDGHSRIRLLSNQDMLHFSRLAIFNDHACMSKKRITLLFSNRILLHLACPTINLVSIDMRAWLEPGIILN